MDWQIFFLITHYQNEMLYQFKIQSQLQEKSVEMWHKNHEFGKEYLGSGMMIANVYFTTSLVIRMLKRALEALMVLTRAI